ncbi:MAG: DUF1697 domain-containing protein [Acidimicrobiia bacterium]|nr:DUF1697 domain-containing protein [Acidimicrobiia bacterium]
MRYVILLKGINVGGRHKVPMADLRRICVALGGADVRTYVQSGNVVLDVEEGAATLPARISATIAAEYGHAGVHVIARTTAELAAVVDSNPFLARGCDPAKLHFTFTAGDADAAGLDGVASSGFEPDGFAPGPGGFYVHCPNGYGRTKLDNAFFERRTAQPATTRNWKTVTALLALAES